MSQSHPGAMRTLKPEVATTTPEVWSALAQLDLITNAIPAYVSYVGPDLRYRFVNDSYVKGFHRSADELVGMHIRDLVGSESFAQLLPQLTRALSGERVNVEMDFRRATGEIRHFRGHYTPDIGADGEVKGIIVMQNDVTETKRAEEAARDRELQLRLALNVAQMGTCDVELPSGKTKWDAAHERLFGFDHDPSRQYTQEDFAARLHPEDRADFQAALAAALEKDHSMEAEFRIVLPRGEIRWIQSNATILRKADGAPYRLIGIVKDITEQKRHEQLLKESEMKVRTLLDRMPQLIWSTTPDGSPNYANNRCEDYTGLDITKKENAGWTKSLHGSDVQHVYDVWSNAMQSGSAFEAEYRLRDRDGRYRWFLGRALPVRSEDGAIVEWFGTATDIHDRMVAEERQKRIQQKVLGLQMISTALAKAYTPPEIAQSVIDHGIAGASADAGAVVLFNEKTLRPRLLYSRGYCPDTLKEWEDLAAQGHPALMRLLAPAEPFLISTEKELRTFHPEIAQLSCFQGRKAFAVFPLIVRGQHLGTLGFTFNEDQDFSHDRISYLTILAEQCAQAMERARLLEGEKIARKNAEIANRAKSQFLANMSHEIRTPMNAILGFSDLMSDKTLSEAERQDYRRRIRANGDQLLRLIDDVLDLSKVEAGKLEIEKVEFSIAELVRDVHDSLSVMLEQKGVTSKLSIDARVPQTVESDPTRLRQVLTNLLGNAAKFTAAGSIETRISLWPSPQPGGEPSLVIDVIDTGVGIPSELHSLLFQPFAQADSSVTRRFGGTGLGLVLSRRIAEALGGKLELVQSAPNEGSLFRLTLPATSAGHAPKIDVRSTEKSAAAAKVPARELDGVRLLIAEDAIDNEVLIRAYLKPTGAIVQVAHNGREAVEQALSADFDLILMDIQMPEMDGLEATRSLRSQGYNRPIIALSAHALSEELQRSITAGCQAHLTKPVKRAVLIEAIKKHLGQPPGTAGPQVQ